MLTALWTQKAIQTRQWVSSRSSNRKKSKLPGSCSPGNIEPGWMQTLSSRSSATTASCMYLGVASPAKRSPSPALGHSAPKTCSWADAHLVISFWGALEKDSGRGELLGKRLLKQKGLFSVRLSWEISYWFSRTSAALPMIARVGTLIEREHWWSPAFICHVIPKILGREGKLPVSPYVSAFATARMPHP